MDYFDYEYRVRYADGQLFRIGVTKLEEELDLNKHEEKKDSEN